MMITSPSSKSPNVMENPLPRSIPTCVSRMNEPWSRRHQWYTCRTIKSTEIGKYIALSNFTVEPFTGLNRRAYLLCQL